PLFVSLRDSANLKGKCGVCEFREVCGGSRARAYALTGDVFAEEPCCTWQPKSYRRDERAADRISVPEQVRDLISSALHLPPIRQSE
ncbi:MAG TPA: hypothetical protein VGU64_02360, partial [Terriglobales bacterium]|nr:hypothetical protein [Terriglobales bacterium]